jgi:hypothetical protein
MSHDELSSLVLFAGGLAPSAPSPRGVGCAAACSAPRPALHRSYASGSRTYPVSVGCLHTTDRTTRQRARRICGNVILRGRNLSEYVGTGSLHADGCAGFGSCRLPRVAGLCTNPGVGMGVVDWDSRQPETTLAGECGRWW